MRDRAGEAFLAGCRMGQHTGSAISTEVANGFVGRNLPMLRKSKGRAKASSSPTARTSPATQYPSAQVN